jgi:hypothetical protein
MNGFGGRGARIRGGWGSLQGSVSFGSLRLLGLGTLEGVDDVLIGTTPVKELVIIQFGG